MGHPPMALPNRLKIVSDLDLSRVHEASLKVLKETGVVFHCEEALKIFKTHGAKVDGKIVYFPEKMVESALESCPSTFIWRARNSSKSITVGEGFLIQPMSGSVYVEDLDSGRRLGNLKDFSNIAKIHHASDVTKFVGGNWGDLFDVKDSERHLYAISEILKSTDKPIFSYSTHGHKARQMLDMVEIAFGTKNGLENNHILGITIAPISPLFFPKDVTQSLIAFAKTNQFVSVIPATIAGVTGPIKPLGTAVLQNIENLAGIVLAQLINPGNPVVYSHGGTTGYMKYASFSTGAPEMMLINMVNVQMALDFYHLPDRSMPAMTESSKVDCQAGYETMQGLLMAMLSGTHFLHESLGCIESIMTTSYEKIIIDEELFSRALHICEGIDTSDAALSVDIIQEVGHTGTYLDHSSTLEHFRENWIPFVSDWSAPSRSSPSENDEDVLVKANRIWKQRLRNAPESLIDREIDKELRAYIKTASKKSS
jgi:trimethylamine--corrinoid protein Co-methyltransferase